MSKLWSKDTNEKLNTDNININLLKRIWKESNNKVFIYYVVYDETRYVLDKVNFEKLLKLL